MNVDVEMCAGIRYTLVIAIVGVLGVGRLSEGDVSVMALPQLSGRPMVTDGGMETDLIFHHGVDLPLCDQGLP